MLRGAAGARKLLYDLVQDLATVRTAYERVGLLNAAPGRLALKLLGGGESTDRFRRDFLLLDALLRNRVAWLAFDGGGLRHVAVFGGNNVGKSTIVNILAGAQIAGVSPEGGHTRHLQAFVQSGGPLAGENPFALLGFSPVSVDALNDDRSDTYAVTPITSALLMKNITLWDTPDCDSTGALHYLGAVVEAVALADLVLYVTTVEKYAVADLVEWLLLLHSAGIPLLECLNKTPRKDRAAVIARQRDTILPTLAERLGLAMPDPPIVALRYLVEGTESDLWGPDHPEASELRERVHAMLAMNRRREAGLAALDFVRRQLPALLEPVVLEIEAKSGWRRAVDHALHDFIGAYERNYLVSDRVIEPFTRLNLELLQLLDPDIPHLKQAIQIVRRVVRWQNTLVIAAARQLSRIARQVSAPGESAEAPAPPELAAYADAHLQLLNTLGRRIEAERAHARHHPFWDIAGEEWQAGIGALSEAFAARIRQHMDDTDRAIKDAARDIFDELRKQPALLALLRGARIAADVGGIALTLVVPHVGGLVYDLLEESVLAQLMTGMTEAATAAAVRGFVTNRRRLLRDKLLQDARRIAELVYAARLNAVADAASSRAGAIGLGAELVERLQTELDQFAGAVGQAA